MNKCIYLSKKNLVDYSNLKDVAENCGIELYPTMGEIPMITSHYMEKCPILVDGAKWYGDILESLSPKFCEDVYLLEGDNVYQNDKKIGSIKQFFESDIFKALFKKQNREECSEIISQYFKTYNDSDWRIGYISDVLCEMYYFDKKEPSDELLEFVFKRDRLEKDEEMPVSVKLERILKRKTGQRDFKGLNEIKLFALLYKDVFKNK